MNADSDIAMAPSTRRPPPSLLYTGAQATGPLLPKNEQPGISPTKWQKLPPPPSPPGPSWVLLSPGNARPRGYTAGPVSWGCPCRDAVSGCPGASAAPGTGRVVFGLNLNNLDSTMFQKMTIFAQSPSGKTHVQGPSPGVSGDPR